MGIIVKYLYLLQISPGERETRGQGEEEINASCVVSINQFYNSRND